MLIFHLLQIKKKKKNVPMRVAKSTQGWQGLFHILLGLQTNAF